MLTLQKMNQKLRLVALIYVCISLVREIGCAPRNDAHGQGMGKSSVRTRRQMMYYDSYEDGMIRARCDYHHCNSNSDCTRGCACNSSHQCITASCYNRQCRHNNDCPIYCTCRQNIGGICKGEDYGMG